MSAVYLKELRARFRLELSQAYPPEEIDSIFYLLIAHYLEYPKMILALQPKKQIKGTEAARLLNALEDLKAHRPVQHIIGHACFMDMNLKVSPDVLIPRPETAELVDWIAGDFSGKRQQHIILDVGTGSGCISLGLKRHLPHAEIHGIDISEEALKIATSNAKAHNLDVMFYKGDLMDPESVPSEFDVLVSNPPYVPQCELGAMQAHVRHSEPHLALFVPDDAPLLNYHYLCELAVRKLKMNGWMYLETHEDFATGVAALLENRGFRAVEIKKDIFGKDRFVRGQWLG
jgi:release factor glutamine methyltransferase